MNSRVDSASVIRINKFCCFVYVKVTFVLWVDKHSDPKYKIQRHHITSKEFP